MGWYNDLSLTIGGFNRVYNKCNAINHETIH